MLGDWLGLFRTQMLHLMPAHDLGEHFDPRLGCPTKELYAMARVLVEQCDVEEGREKPGGKVLQNPSGVEAAYDGHITEISFPNSGLLSFPPPCKSGTGLEF
ncbi:MAG: hypothetical protein GXP25_15480 [Planctomycetes bacterium]|nr:hypothetical protein [Planctomycetota bacterium]